MRKKENRKMLLRSPIGVLGLVDQSALGTSGALSPSAGGNKSLPSGAIGASAASPLSVAGAVIRSVTEEPADLCAARTVRVIEVTIKQAASTQVILPNAVAAERPVMAPPPPPLLPMPSPPPSERCKSTTAIRPRAKRRWMMRTTFSIGSCGCWLSIGR